MPATDQSAKDEAASAMLKALEKITGHFAGVMGGPLVTGQGIAFANGIEGIPTIANARAAIAAARAAGIKGA
jgi:hypothetical protein